MRKKTVKEDQYIEREAQKYEHPIASREFILELLVEAQRPLTYPQLIKKLDIDDADQQEALRRRLRAMVRDGQLLQNRRGAFGLIDKMELIKGYVIGHKDGFGFVVPEDGGEDLFLSARQMRTIFPNDEVLVRAANVDERGRREGIIVEVLQRHTHELVGRFVSEASVSLVEPANQRISQAILIPTDARGGAQPGQMVVVKIIEQPSVAKRPVGEIIEILGNHMAPGMEIDVAMRNHQLPYEWPEQALKEASEFSPTVTENTFGNRLDLRSLPFVTIDGEDAKDFDDAVYCQPQTKGGWTLYVAIADVSYYVKPNTALDKEAFKRGNSVYFPGQVIPMLPEVLSNALCSLQPDVNRLTQVCEMEITAAGKIANYTFYEAVIKSHARLTYNQVYDMVTQDDTLLQSNYKKLLPSLQELFVVYRILHAARIKRGAIDFDLPETKIIFGPGRKIERIVALLRNDAHRLIEECMLSANICAARFLIKHKYPGLFRVHTGPTQVKLADLRKFLGELGLKLPGGEEPVPADYATLLKQIGMRPDARLIQTILLRSLSQAVYSPENKGHFGLAFDAYAHFTSPIRRYPDLLVHRAIRNILQAKPAPASGDLQFIKYGEHCSMTERRADEATREAVDWLKCEFMQDKLGQEYDGTITSVTSFGLFIELNEIYVEGLVHISMLQNDYYKFDSIKHALSGQRTGKRYRLGDKVKVKVVRVDLDQRQIDFVITDELVEKRPPKKKKPKKNAMKEAVLIFGWHAVTAFLHNQPKNITRLALLKSRHDQKMQAVIELAHQHQIKIESLERTALDQLTKQANHQGIVAWYQPAKQYTEQELPLLLEKLTQPAFLLILDGIQDPHNLGACLRSAVAAGVHAVIAPKDKSAGLTPTVCKTASGAAEIIPFIQVTNLARTLRWLKEQNIWLFGAAGEAKDSLYQADLTLPLALIVGAEGVGMRRLTREHCDVLLHVPMQSTIASLNVSVAAGIFLFEVVRQRTNALILQKIPSNG